jgi:hypothetical protein
VVRGVALTTGIFDTRPLPLQICSSKVKSVIQIDAGYTCHPQNFPVSAAVINSVVNIRENQNSLEMKFDHRVYKLSWLENGMTTKSTSALNHAFDGKSRSIAPGRAGKSIR